MKLIGEIFPWSPESLYVYPSNAHNSLMGMRAYTEQFVCVPQELLYTYHDEDKAIQDIRHFNVQGAQNNVQTQSPTYSLLGLPGECNFSGRRLNTRRLPHLSNQLHRQNPSHTFLTVLDAAKLAGSSAVQIKCVCEHVSDSSRSEEHRSDTQRCACMPDFIVMSFYKIFGTPTGLGACIIKNDVLSLLRKKYFGGGTIQQGHAYTPWCVPRDVQTHAHYEDGTMHYQGVLMARNGFRFIRKLGGMAAIEHHVHKIWIYLTERLTQLKHSSGVSLCVVYSASPTHTANTYTSSQQGGVVAFNVCFSDGTPVGHGQIQKDAEKRKIYFRTGNFAQSFAASMYCDGESIILAAFTNFSPF